MLLAHARRARLEAQRERRDVADRVHALERRVVRGSGGKAAEIAVDGEPAAAGRLAAQLALEQLGVGARADADDGDAGLERRAVLERDGREAAVGAGGKAGDGRALDDGDALGGVEAFCVFSGEGVKSQEVWVGLI